MKNSKVALFFQFSFFKCVFLLFVSAAYAEIDDVEWHNYGNDAGGSKYSPAAQIDSSNVHQLEIAWTWDNPDDLLASKIKQRPGSFKATPLMIGGILYLSTSLNQVAAVNAKTGTTIWTYDPKAYRRGRPANSGWQHRGVAYWEGGNNNLDQRILIATGTGELLALNAKTGQPISSFGNKGVVDLQTGIVKLETDRKFIGYNAAPTIVKDTVLLGCTVMDRPVTVQYVTCPIRAFDIKTGELKWSFNTVPKKEEPESNSWKENSWEHSGAANAWATFSADLEAGLVYVPTGTPHNDYYGGHRKGDNRHAESLLCLDVDSGELVWSYQAIHHGLWDYDFPAAPTLANIKVNGKTIKAVAQVSKQGFTYVFDRLTGVPVWPIVERPVPQSTIAGEETSATQPFPTKPPPFVRQGISEDDLIDFTPELRAEALDIVKDFVLGPIFTPPAILGEDGKKGVIQVPGAAGGANWGGAGLDPETGILYVQAAEMPTPAYVSPGKEGEADFHIQMNVFPMGPRGLPLLKPPYGTVNAIDLNKGTMAWQVPHGKGPVDHPAIKHLNLPSLGAGSHTFMSSGGPLVTKTLLFVNQAQVIPGSIGLSKTERYLRAFNKTNGKVLWETRMKLAPYGTPMTYVYQGKQYVVIAAGGSGEASKLIAYALP